VEVVVVQTSEEESAIARAKEYNFPVRRYGNDLAFWLTEPLELKEMIARLMGFLGFDFTSTVRLEHIYVEVRNR
jgi:ABC-2 type transport system ATP-binding protein